MSSITKPKLFCDVSFDENFVIESSTILDEKLDQLQIQTSLILDGWSNYDTLAKSVKTEDDSVNLNECGESPSKAKKKSLPKSFLFKMSKYTSLPILMEWIRVVDYGRLDTALCNFLCRDNFVCLTTYQLLKNVLQNSENQYIVGTPKLLSWLVERDVTSLLPLSKVKFTNETLQAFFEETNRDIFSYIESLFHNFKCIKMTNLADRNFKILAMTVQCSNQLTELSLTASDCETKSFDYIINSVVVYCKKLTSLDVSNCTNISEQSIVNVCKECRSLSSLNVSHCINMSQHLINAVAQHCCRLKSLNISGCLKIQKNEIMVLGYYQKTYYEHIVMSDILISDFALDLYVKHSGRKLMTLNIGIYSDDLQNSSINLTDSGIRALTSDKCPALLHLNLHGCSHVTDIGIKSAVTNFPQLQSLNIHGLLRLTDESIHDITINCTSMLHLVLGEDLNDLSSSGASSPSTNKECVVHFTSEALVTINLLNLQTLCLSRAVNLTVNTIEHILQSVTKVALCTLDISNKKLDSRYLAICIRAHGQSFKSLNVARCNINNDAAIAIADTCYALTKINLSGNHMVYDDAVCALLSNCKDLQSLNIQSCNGLTAICVFAIGDKCSGLKELFLSQNSAGSSVACVEHVLLHCRKLEKLYLSGGYVLHVSEWSAKYINTKIIVDLYEMQCKMMCKDIIFQM